MDNNAQTHTLSSERDTITYGHAFIHVIAYLYPIRSQCRLWYAHDWLAQKMCLKFSQNAPQRGFIKRWLQGGTSSDHRWFECLVSWGSVCVCVCGRVRGVSLSDLGSCLHSGDLDLNSLSPQTVHIHESNTHTHARPSEFTTNCPLVWSTCNKMFVAKISIEWVKTADGRHYTLL